MAKKQFYLKMMVEEKKKEEHREYKEYLARIFSNEQKPAKKFLKLGGGREMDCPEAVFEIEKISNVPAGGLEAGAHGPPDRGAAAWAGLFGESKEVL
eukprot:6258150-Pyramimonas_sp.AAC.1